jgi:hypothetical protein
MSCRSGCKTKDCASYAACCRNSAPRVAYANSANGYDATKQKKWDRELDRYRGLVSQGLEPSGTTHREMDTYERKVETVANLL